MENVNQGTLHQSADDANRKAYSKPEFRFEEVFETMALACGKTPAGGSQCNFNRKNS